jgi:hypothetical protein
MTTYASVQNIKDKTLFRMGNTFVPTYLKTKTEAPH